MTEAGKPEVEALVAGAGPVGLTLACERLLIDRLAKLGGQVERPAELLTFRAEDGGVSATLRTAMGQEQTLRARWLLGCDGARSTVRQGLQLPFEGATYEEHYALADLR